MRKWLRRIGESLWVVLTAFCINASGYMLGKGVNMDLARWVFVGGIASIFAFGFYNEWRGFRGCTDRLTP